MTDLLVDDKETVLFNTQKADQMVERNWMKYQVLYGLHLVLAFMLLAYVLEYLT